MNKNIVLNGLQLNYEIFNEEKKETILFLHGNSSSSHSFSQQKKNDFLPNYRLLFLNLPGHGISAKSHDYSLPFLGRIICDFVGALGLENYILVGHSFGGHVALHSLKHLCPSGIFLFGTPPMSVPFNLTSFLPNDLSCVLFQEDPSLKDVMAFGSDLALKGEVLATFSDDFMATDPAFRASLLENIGKGIYENEKELLRQYQGKVRVLIPTCEKIVNNDYVLEVLHELARPFQIETILANHCIHLENPSLFNHFLSTFVTQVFEGPIPLTTKQFINQDTFQKELQ
jgi:pimeloyl-ACP methyl ester carboxylesterase